MLLLVLKAYTQLIRFDISLARGNFAVLYDTVRSSRVGKNVGRPHSIDQICKAIDMACIWYRKQVLCLQRSAATACLLKQYGFKAEMVMGAQHMPFKAQRMPPNGTSSSTGVKEAQNHERPIRTMEF
jgi:hypothetical protein